MDRHNFLSVRTAAVWNDIGAFLHEIHRENNLTIPKIVAMTYHVDIILLNTRGAVSWLMLYDTIRVISVCFLQWNGTLS